MHTIDGSFKRRKQESMARRSRQRRRRIVGTVAGLGAIAAAAGLYFAIDRLLFNDVEEELAPTDLAGVLPDDASVYVPTIVDLAGDPMWIVLAGGSETGAVVRSIAKPAALAEMARVLKPGGRLQVADILVRKAVPDSAKRDIALWTG